MKFNLGRFTGIVGVVVLTMGSLAFSISSDLINYDDARETAYNIIESESKFRLSVVCALLMETIFILYAFLLYKILRKASSTQAALFLILALVAVPLFMLNQVNKVGALLMAKQQAYEQVLFFLELHKYGGLIVSIFFGLWLFPLGLSIYRSGFIPKIIGVLLMIGCFGYIIQFVQGFLYPGTEMTLWTNPVLIVTHVSELLLMLWLLIKGVTVRTINMTA